MKKTCLFMFLIISFFSIPPLHVRRRLPYMSPKKITLVSGKAGDEKNHHPGTTNLFFSIDFPEYPLFLFSFLCFFLFFCLFVCLMFFEIKSIYSDTNLTRRASEWQKDFHPADFRKQDLFFGLIKNDSSEVDLSTA